MTFGFAAGSAAAHGDEGETLADRFPLSGRELLLIGCFWAFLAAVTELNRIFDPSGVPTQVTSVPTALVFFRSFLWALLTPPLFQLAGSVIGRPVDFLSRAGLLVAGGLLAAILVSVVMNLGIALLSVTPRQNPQPLWQVGGFAFLNDIMTAMGVMTAGVARAYLLRFRSRQEHAARLQAQLAEARLDALRRQLDPHFLFNTLHAISSLVERDPRGVRRMISRLSELLRHSFDEAGAPEVSLRDELEFLALYIDIMQVRFQGRLQVDVTADEEALSACVPNLVLQPLVENAIKHGIEKLTGTGVIRIEARRDGAQLVLRVLDNGPGPEARVVSAERPQGVGVRNTIARLQQLYGPAQSFGLTRDDDGHTVAEVRLPFRLRGELRTAGVLVPERGALRAG
jgi:signal transduction histidine kinase